MRISLLLTVLCLLSLVAVCVHGLPDEATHVDAIEQHELDLDIQQPTGAPSRTPGATPTPTRTTRTTTPATPATRPRTTRPRTGSPLSPRTPRTGLMFPRRMMERLRMDPNTGMGMGMEFPRLSMFERRMLRRLFRRMLRLRLREMFDGVPASRWEMRVIRMMALRDMMMAMDVQAEDAAELAQMVDQREAQMDAEVETSDDTTDTETETSETESEIDEHDTEAMPEDTLVEHELDEPTMIESEFDISAPYGGYGGYSYGGYGYSGYGEKKQPPYKKAPYKKQPYKKVPYKKVPYKQVPYKKGYGGYGYGGY